MKKYNVLALVGTLALLANLLVPGIAFGVDDTSGEAGYVSLDCYTDAYSISVTPATDFSFQDPDDSTGETFQAHLYASTSDNWAYNNTNNPNSSAGLNVVSGANHDYIEIRDQRNPSDPTCNDGLTLTLNALNPGSPTDTRYFDDNDGVASGHSIPLNTTYVVSSADRCPAGFSNIGSDVCVETGVTLCGNGSGVIPHACDGADGVTAANYDGLAFATWATFTGSGEALGTGTDTPVVGGIDVLAFENDHELFGKAGVGVSYGTLIPAGQPAGIYVLRLEYVLAGVHA